MGILKRFGRSGARMLAGAALALAGGIAAAAISDYDVFKVEVYTQTDGNVPLAPDGYYFAARIIGDTGLVGAVATLTLPDANVLSLAPDATARVHSGSSPLFTSQATFDALFSAGTYRHSIDHPSLPGAPQTGELVLPASAYPGSVPYFTNADDVHGISAAAPFTFTWNAFVPGADPQAVSETFLRLSSSAGTLDYDVTPAQSLTISGGVLAAGTTYSATLYFSSRLYVDGAGFDGGDGPTARSLVGFDRATTLTFTTAPVPEPFGWALMLAGLGPVAWLAARRRRGRA